MHGEEQDVTGETTATTAPGSGGQELSRTQLTQQPDSILGSPTAASRESASATTSWLMSEINSLMNKSCCCWQTDQGSKTLERKGTGNAGLQKKNYQELTRSKVEYCC
jgi:hypothetical protein